MAKTRTSLVCSDCGTQSAQWVGRCPSCGSWGSMQPGKEGGKGTHASPEALVDLGDVPESDRRVATGLTGVDRVLGGGLVPGSVSMLAGPPGIGKSTLLLQLMAGLSAAGEPCLLVSGEESHGQVGARAKRLGIAGNDIAFAPGRDLEQVLDHARAAHPRLLAVDSIQTLRDTSGSQMLGGVAQVRACTDALVGLAKTEGIAVVITGHVTKDGDLAGPRSLEHAVDVVLAFDGDARSGMRVLAGGKNRFGAEGETAWFEMTAAGLREIDPSDLLISGERVAGAATALPQSGRRALAVEVQALVSPTEGPARRQATGLDARRFQLVAAVLDRAGGLSLGRCELYGATSGGARVEDPACDLAVAAALASAATGALAPEASAFVGEVALTGLVRPAPAMAQRLAAARAAGCTTMFAAAERSPTSAPGVRIVPVRTVAEALTWAFPPAGTGRRTA